MSPQDLELEKMGNTLNTLLDSFDESLGDKVEELPAGLKGEELVFAACDNLFDLLSEPIKPSNREAADTLRYGLLALLPPPKTIREANKLRNGDDLRVAVNAVKAYAQALVSQRDASGG